MSDSNRGSEQGGYGRGWASEATGWASDASGKVGDTIEDSPLIALGAGLAAGALIAALLPTTRKERELLSPVGDRLTGAARGAADAARRAGSDKLKELGLSPDSLVDKAGEAAREAAQAAVGSFKDEAGAS